MEPNFTIIKSQYRQVNEPLILPRGHGVAYVDYMADVTVTAIMPLNWLIGWYRNIYWLLRRGPGKTKLENKFVSDALPEKRKREQAEYEQRFKDATEKGLSLSAILSNDHYSE